MTEQPEAGRQRGDLRVDLGPARRDRVREVAALLEMGDSELLRRCIDLALPRLLDELAAAGSVVCHQTAAIGGALAAGAVREVRTVEAAPSLRVSVGHSAAKTPRGAAVWRQNPLPLPVPHPHPHTHEREGDLGQWENPSPEGVCEGEVQEGDSCRQNAAKRPRHAERAEFLVWFSSYPLPIGQAAAWRAWQNTRRERPPLAEMLDALDAQRASARWQEGTIPNPGRYLREYRWKDDPQHLTAVLVDARGRRGERETRQLAAPGERAAPVEFDLAARLRELAEALPQELPRRADRAESVRRLAGEPLDAAERALLALEAEAERELDSLLAEGERAALEARVDAGLGQVRKRLPAGEADLRRQELRRRMVRQRFGLNLSLWGSP